MTFPLLRLPFLALREVIKSMNVRNILLFRTRSRKCHQFVKASVSKKSSLKISFTLERNFINVELAPKIIYGVEWPHRDIGCLYKIGDDLLLRVFFSTCNYCAKFRWIRSGQVADDEDFIKSMLEYFVDIMDPLVSFEFYEGIRQEFAMELIRYCRQKHIRLFSIDFFYGNNASPEFVREILEGRIEVDGSLAIRPSLPKGFEYTPPPGGFKLKGINISDAHWVNLNDFLQCKRVTVRGDLSHMTPQYLDTVFKTILNTECRIRFLFLSGTPLNQINHPEIIKGLSDRPLEAKGRPLCVKFKARNGRETSIHFHKHVIVLQISSLRFLRRH